MRKICCAGVNTDGPYLSWYINPQGGSSGNFGGTVDLRDYIEVPEGFEVKKVTVEESSIDGVNDPVSDMYDNAIIKITIKTLYNELTQEEIELPDPTELPTEEPTEEPENEPGGNKGTATSDGDGLIDIFDEDVPLADVPKTGDISALWMALSSLSAGGLLLLKKRKF